ncbi:MAG: hypothetical protein M0Q53_10430 [Prolixibacteraceae bacterium]|jgi:hypothetical protein|nr:hypothetical protein [Prolixibacteraceae bacterium]
MNHEQDQDKECEGFRENEVTRNRTIDRKEAIKKAGYIALSATTMMLLLGKPDKTVAQSPQPPPAWP